MHLISDWACPVDVSLIWNVITEPLFLFSLLFFVWLLLFALLYTLWRSYMLHWPINQINKGPIEIFGWVYCYLTIYKKREFCLCLLCNKTAVEGTNDMLKSIVLGRRESLGSLSFSFFFLLLSVARFSSDFSPNHYWHRVVSTDRETRIEGGGIACFHYA